MTYEEIDYEEIEFKVARSSICIERTIFHLGCLLHVESAAVSPQTNEYIEDIRKVINHLEERLNNG
jgi:hypothetical protein